VSDSAECLTATAAAFPVAAYVQLSLSVPPCAAPFATFFPTPFPLLPPPRVSVCGSLCFCRQPFGSCQIVSCGCHTLRISNAPYAASLQTQSKNPALSSFRPFNPSTDCSGCLCQVSMSVLSITECQTS